jgi:hypothetical protein
MRHEVLDIGNVGSFEPYSDAQGKGVLVPIMDEYPNPDNQFDVFLGSDGEKSQVDPNLVASGVEAVASAATLFQKTELEKQLILRCGRRPLIGKDNKAKWEACRDNFFSSSNVPQTAVTSGKDFVDPVMEKKGLSPLAIGGIVLGLAAVGFGVYMLAKKK